MKRLFLKEEIVLLQNSNVIRDYPALQELMTTSPDMMADDITSLPTALQNTVKHEYPRIVGVAKAEWTHLFEDGYDIIDVNESEEYDHCELCGSTNCKLLFPIGNYDKSVILYVGSSCINRFMKSSAKATAEAAKRYNELRLYSRLEKYFPGVYDRFIASTASSCASDTAYLVTDPLYSECQKSFLTIRQLCEKHQKADEEDIPAINVQLQNELAHYDDVSIRIDQYLKDAESNWKIPTRMMVSRATQLRKSKAIQQVRKDGEITKITLRYFDELKFLENRMAPIVSHIIELSPLALVKVIEINGIGGYVVKIKTNNVQLFIRHADFATAYGVHIFSNIQSGKIENLLRLCHVTSDTDIRSLLTSVRDALRQIDCKLLGYEKEMNELYLQIGSSIYVASLSGALELNMPFFIASALFPIKQARSLLGDNSTTITLQEWNDRLNDYSVRDIVSLL